MTGTSGTLVFLMGALAGALVTWVAIAPVPIVIDQEGAEQLARINNATRLAAELRGDSSSGAVTQAVSIAQTQSPSADDAVTVTPDGEPYWDSLKWFLSIPMKATNSSDRMIESAYVEVFLIDKQGNQVGRTPHNVYRIKPHGTVRFAVEFPADDVKRVPPDHWETTVRASYAD